MYTLERLRKENLGYANGEDEIRAKDLEKINRIIERIEQTRADKPQEFDSVVYTNEYGDYFPFAIIAGDTYHDGGTALCERGSASVDLDEQGRPCGSISGGAFPKINPERLLYIGKTERRFWTFSALGAGAHRGIYFTATVSNFELNERPEPMRKYTTEFYDEISVSDAGENRYGTGYRYKVMRKQGNDFYYAWRAFASREGLDDLLKRYEAVPETPNDDAHYWILREKDHFVLAQEEFDSISADYERCEMFNGREVPHKYIKRGTELHRYILRADEKGYTA